MVSRAPEGGYGGAFQAARVLYLEHFTHGSFEVSCGVSRPRCVWYERSPAGGNSSFYLFSGIGVSILRGTLYKHFLFGVPDVTVAFAQSRGLLGAINVPA